MSMGYGPRDTPADLAEGLAHIEASNKCEALLEIVKMQREFLNKCNRWFNSFGESPSIYEVIKATDEKLKELGVQI